MLSETVVQNVKVLAIDQSASSDKNEPVVVRAVTLEVTPEDAEKLILAEQRGSIQLALRNPLDEKVTQKAGRRGCGGQDQGAAAGAWRRRSFAAPTWARKFPRTRVDEAVTGPDELSGGRENE